MSRALLQRVFGPVMLVALVGCATQGELAPLRAVQEVPAAVLNPDVRPETIHQTICVAGYAASVRPATSFTNGVKAKLMREAGIPLADTGLYELDHRVALAVGGHPRSLFNLQLQHWGGDDGAKRKDVLERRVQLLVCSGRLALKDAQAALYFNWQAAYSKYVGKPTN